MTVEEINEEIKNVDSNLISDGYHTFKELYEHRIVLYIALCTQLRHKYKVWMSDTHSDGSKWEDWFILGINEEEGAQITYHLPMKYWSDCEGFASVKEKAPDFDGHTSKDVLNRLTVLIITSNFK